MSFMKNIENWWREKEQWLRVLPLFFSCFFTINFIFCQAEDSKNLLNQFHQLPLSFEKNQGQTHSDVKYFARGCGYGIYFTSQDIVMHLQKASKTENTFSSALLKIQFIGATDNLRIFGVDELKCKSHYFIGHDSGKWQTNVSHYAKVSYEELYPGIHAVFYGNQEKLEYDIHVVPGADPKNICLHFEGAQELTIDQSGNLHILIADQEVQMQKPFIYQLIEGEKTTIQGEFVLLDKQDVGFAIKTYDPSLSLIIDPVLVYSSYLGGSAIDRGFAIAVDGSGNAYLTGRTTSSDFPLVNPFQSIYGGNDDAFISKINPSLSGSDALIYSTFLGGTGDDLGNSIALDSHRNIYIAGETTSTNFPVTLTNAFQTTLQGTRNAFITKIDSTGSTLLYSSYLGGSSEDQALGIAVDSKGNAYITGGTDSTDFPVVLPAIQPTLVGTRNAFVSKINPSLSGTNSLVYSTYLGSGPDDRALGIALDPKGNAYITGRTNSPTFPVTPFAVQPLYGGGTSDAFVSKINSKGTNLAYSTFLGGSDDDRGFAIAVDSDGNAYVTGQTKSTDFPITPGAYQPNLGGGGTFLNAFITKLNSAGTDLIYSTYLGGDNGDSFGTGIKTDTFGNAYLTGETFDNNFPQVNSIQEFEGISDVFVSKLNAFGSDLLFSTFLGGNGKDEGLGIALDSNGNAYVTGSTNSTDFPLAPPLPDHPFQSILKGPQDAFISKLAIGTPTITNVNPNQGFTTGGTDVIITGTNFTNVSEVFFGSIPAKSFVVVSDQLIIARSPLGTGTVDVTVVGVGGTSPTTPQDQFTYRAFPPKHLQGFQKKERESSSSSSSHKKIFNILKWDAPKEGFPIAEYRIYRDSHLNNLIGVVPGDGKLRFKDRIQKKGKKHTYFVVSVDELGNTSEPAKVVIR